MRKDLELYNKHLRDDSGGSSVKLMPMVVACMLGTSCASTSFISLLGVSRYHFTPGRKVEMESGTGRVFRFLVQPGVSPEEYTGVGESTEVGENTWVGERKPSRILVLKLF